MRSILFVLTGFLVGVSAKDVHPPVGDFAPKCLVGSGIYNESKSAEVPWLTVDLDLPYEQRYGQIVAPFADDMKAVIAIVKQMAAIFTPGGNTSWIDQAMQYAYDELFPNSYKQEIRGIADATGISTADLALMNIFYELSRFCTSIIAETYDGTLFHARNLDFGQLFVWANDTRSWALTDALKKVTVNINFVRNNTLLFMGTTFAGHTGIITGMKPKTFTISMNAKALLPDTTQLAKWFHGDYNNTDLHFAMWAEREIMENCNSFQEAEDYLSTITQLAGCYYILGGPNSGEGVILVRNATDVTAKVSLDADNWYILQTNYDPDQLPMFLDDRRDPGNTCMRQLGRGNVTAAGIYEVLSSKTTLNKTTVHTVIMSITTGLYQTFIQYCYDPCWAF